jgi:hypothetical protein
MTKKTSVCSRGTYMCLSFYNIYNIYIDDTTCIKLPIYTEIETLGRNPCYPIWPIEPKVLTPISDCHVIRIIVNVNSVSSSWYWIQSIDINPDRGLPKAYFAQSLIWLTEAMIKNSINLLSSWGFDMHQILFRRPFDKIAQLISKLFCSFREHFVLLIYGQMLIFILWWRYFYFFLFGSK